MLAKWQAIPEPIIPIQYCNFWLCVSYVVFICFIRICFYFLPIYSQKSSIYVITI
jgi:hypothetical protein